MEFFGDGLPSRDLRNLSTVPLRELGINRNPYDKDELFFLTDAGMGYGDIIRICYYAKRIAKMTGKRCRVVFTILNITRKKHIMRVPEEEKDDVVFRVWEERKKIRKVISYFKEDLPNVKMVLYPTTPEEFGSRVERNLVPFLLPSRTFAVTSWLGFPQLKPSIEPTRGNHIAVWTTEKNLTPVNQWKDPTGWEKMEEYFQELEKAGHEIRRVSYRDDIEYVFETIASAKMCIGYEGMGNLISQMFRKPILVFSENAYHSKVTSGMWAEISPTIKEKHRDVEGMIIDQVMIAKSEPPRKQIFNREDIQFFGGLDEDI